MIKKRHSKRCARCAACKPLTEFYIDRRGIRSARCSECHGHEYRTCAICGQTFYGRSSRRFCSLACRRIYRPRTSHRCEMCQIEFPVDRFARRFCSVQCKVIAQRTGRRVVRCTLAKARTAQSLVRYHIQAGHIVRPSICEECGATGGYIEAAHYNYDEPLRVRWLCRSCHRRWDKKEPKGATVVIQRLVESNRTNAPDVAEALKT